MQFPHLFLAALMGGIKLVTTLETQIVSTSIIPQLPVLPEVTGAQFESRSSRFSTLSSQINARWLVLLLLPRFCLCQYLLLNQG
jgi:hypothetical protein